MVKSGSVWLVNHAVPDEEAIEEDRGGVEGGLWQVEEDAGLADE
jgi:hypothetical protein